MNDRHAGKVLLILQTSFRGKESYVEHDDRKKKKKKHLLRP